MDKANLYNTIANKKVFWSLPILGIITGTILTFVIARQSIFFLALSLKFCGRFFG